MARALAPALGCVLVGVLTSCGTGADSDGDCNARVVYEDRVYGPHNALRPSAPTESASSGTGDVVGCAGEAVDQVAVFEIRGVDPTVAVAVVDSEWRGIYALEGTTSGDWPALIEAAGS